jgi:hypothetical protein
MGTNFFTEASVRGFLAAADTKLTPPDLAAHLAAAFLPAVVV